MSDAIFDYDEMLARCVGKEDLLERAMKRFGEDLTVDLDALTDACNSGDSERIASTAHRIKGASANVSAHQLSAAAADLEACARSNEMAGVSHSLQQVTTAAESLRQFLTIHSME